MKPEVNHAGGLYVFTWKDTGVQISVSNIKQEKGTVSGELHITREVEKRRMHIYQSRLNFLAPRSKSELANILSQNNDEILWKQVIEDLSVTTLELFRQGEPVLELCTEDEFAPVKYVIGPFAPERQMTLLFGDPDSGKSLVGAVTALIVLLPWHDNPLGFQVNGKMRKVLVLDWESDEVELGWRLKALTRGMDLGPVWVHYRRCSLPLADDISEIQRLVLENNIEYLIVDSLGPACGGELKDAGPALRLHGAIRQLGITSLIIAHESKSEFDKKKPTAYGSVFFTALARSIWRAERLESDADLITVLRHTKANGAKRSYPIGIHFQFAGEQITVARQDLEEVEEFVAKLPLARQILVALKWQPLTLEELAQDLGLESHNLLSKTLSQLKKKGQVINVQGKWSKTSAAGDRES